MPGQDNASSPRSPRRRGLDGSTQGFLIMLAGAAIVWQAERLAAVFHVEPALAASVGLLISGSGLVVQRRGRERGR
ncbi:MAG: hypothetical protein IRZ18_03330 [Clostridia bacterium]|nr:hypothetical protein [Clostridia bacterium]